MLNITPIQKAVFTPQSPYKKPISTETSMASERPLNKFLISAQRRAQTHAMFYLIYQTFQENCPQWPSSLIRVGVNTMKFLKFR